MLVPVQQAVVPVALLVYFDVLTPALCSRGGLPSCCRLGGGRNQGFPRGRVGGGWYQRLPRRGVREGCSGDQRLP